MDLRAGEGTGERAIAVIELYRRAGASGQRLIQRLVQGDVNAHALRVAHPAGGLLRLR